MNTPHTKSKTKKQSVSLSALYMVWPHCLTVELTTLSSAVYRKTNLKSINHCATVHTSSLHDAVNLRACYVAWFSLLRAEVTGTSDHVLPIYSFMKEMKEFPSTQPSLVW